MPIACVTHFVCPGQPTSVVLREWRYGLLSVMHASHQQDLKRFRCDTADTGRAAVQFIEFLRLHGQPQEDVLLYPSPHHPDLLDLAPFVVHVPAQPPQHARAC